MKIHCIASLLLFFLIHSICEGKFTNESLEIDDENALHFYHGKLKSEEHHCKCKEENCECCYKAGAHTICSVTKVVTLVDGGNELVFQGKVTINNGSIITCSIKIKEIPKICYHHNKFDTCIHLKHQVAKPNNVKICGHIRTRYSSKVLLSLDLFCKDFGSLKISYLDENYNLFKSYKSNPLNNHRKAWLLEVKKAVGNLNGETEKKENTEEMNKIDVKTFLSQLFDVSEIVYSLLQHLNNIPNVGFVT